jgi:hypothetical protein
MSKGKTWYGFLLGMLLAGTMLMSQLAYGGSYTAGLLVFATGDSPSSTPPRLSPVYIYRCADKTCATQTQLTNSGYIYYTPTWQGINGTAPWGFLYKLGTYALWQKEIPKKGNPVWRSCKATINSSGLDQTHTTCTGLSWTNSGTSDDVVQLSVPAPDTNGFIIASGTLVPKPAPKTPPSPNSTVSAPQRTVTFFNKSSYDAICINPLGILSSTPCSGTDTDSFKVAKGKSYTYTIPAAGANSQAAVVSGIRFAKGQAFVPTGQNLDVNVDPSYATRLEWTMWPQRTKNTTGVTTINTSLVNGYNVGFNFYPNADTICARAHSEGGASHFNVYPKARSMSQFPFHGGNPREYCPAGQVAHDSNNNVLGCYSDCSWATRNSASNQPQLCCIGNYANPPGSSPTPPAEACSTPDQISRPYSTALNTEVLKDGYTWAYDDYRGTFTCDGNASFSMDITNFDTGLNVVVESVTSQPAATACTLSVAGAANSAPKIPATAVSIDVIPPGGSAQRAVTNLQLKAGGAYQWSGTVPNAASFPAGTMVKVTTNRQVSSTAPIPVCMAN